MASRNQQKSEQEYFRDIIGFGGDFLFADNIDEARLMVVQNNGFMPIDDVPTHIGNATTKIPLMRRDKPITQHYCAFWKIDNSGYYVEEFADMLKSVFIDNR